MKYVILFLFGLSAYGQNFFCEVTWGEGDWLRNVCKFDYSPTSDELRNLKCQEVNANFDVRILAVADIVNFEIAGEQREIQCQDLVVEVTEKKGQEPNRTFRGITASYEFCGVASPIFHFSGGYELHDEPSAMESIGRNVSVNCYDTQISNL